MVLTLKLIFCFRVMAMEIPDFPAGGKKKASGIEVIIIAVV